MNIHTYKKDELDALLKRPVRDASELNATVFAVLQDVKERGDAAVRECEERFDKVCLTDFEGLAVDTPEDLEKILKTMDIS